MIFAESEALVHEISIQPCFSPVDVCCAKSLQSCPALCGPLHCSPPDSSAHGNLQAGTLEWVAVSCSRGSSRPRDLTAALTPPAPGTELQLLHLPYQGLNVQLLHLPPQGLSCSSYTSCTGRRLLSTSASWGFIGDFNH